METRTVMEHIERVRLAAEWHSMNEIQVGEMKEACMDLLRALYAEEGAGIIVTAYTLPNEGEDEFKVWCPDRPIATPADVQEAPLVRKSGRRYWDKIQDQFIYED